MHLLIIDGTFFQLQYPVFFEVKSNRLYIQPFVIFAHELQDKNESCIHYIELYLLYESIEGRSSTLKIIRSSRTGLLSTTR